MALNVERGKVELYPPPQRHLEVGYPHGMVFQIEVFGIQFSWEIYSTDRKKK